MPIFEFVCEECGQFFEELVRSSSAIGEVICPSCQGEQVKKQVSIFASKLSSSSGHFNSSFASSCSTGST
ncbi:MAG: zinc ribbon domain-containing protein [Anaerolineales bacterium]|nr:MAG: zinc ribbon domain-containing protein [Anaerolineales bacterium]